MADTHHASTSLKFTDVVVKTLYIVAYIFLYAIGSVLATIIGLVVARLCERLVFRTRSRCLLWDLESTSQSLGVLLAVLAFLTAAECLFALHLFGKVDLNIMEQIAVSLFGITVFGISCVALSTVVAVSKWMIERLLGKIGRAVGADEGSKLLRDCDVESYMSTEEDHGGHWSTANEGDDWEDVETLVPGSTKIKLADLSSVRQLDKKEVQPMSKRPVR